MRLWTKMFAAGLVSVSAAVTPGQTLDVAAGSSAAGATSGEVAKVTYRFERPGLKVPHFRMTIREDGTGRYEAEEITTGTQMGEGDALVGAPSTHVERDVQLTQATTVKIFKMARAERFFQTSCASKAKNIADTGMKTLSYAGPDGKGSCIFNYTENKVISMLNDLFLGIGTTLDEGRKLEFKRRYDRLGLDAELDALTQASDAGRAVELGTIGPLLRQLAGDTEMMQRVRLRSAKLLDRAADGR